MKEKERVEKRSKTHVPDGSDNRTIVAEEHLAEAIVHRVNPIAGQKRETDREGRARETERP